MKKLRTGTFILLVLVLLLTPLFGACTQEAETKTATKTSTETATETSTETETKTATETETKTVVPKDLIIGSIQGLTGSSSEAGMLGVHGQEAAVEYINSNGGVMINGEPYMVKLIGADFASTPDGAITAYNKLVYEDEVKFLIGAPFAPVFPVIAEMAEKDKVFLVHESGVGLDLGPDKTMTLCVQPAQAMYDDMYRVLKEKYPDVKTVAIFAPDEPTGEQDIEFSSMSAEAHGLEVVATAYYAVGETDFYPMLAKILPKNPDAMVSGMGFTGWKANAIKQAREQGWVGPMLEPTCSGDVRDTIGMLGDYAYDFLTGSYSAVDPSLPQSVKDIGVIIKDMFGEDLTMDHITQGWQPVYLIVQAIEMAQSLDPVEVMAYLDTVEGMDTPFGPGILGGLETFGVNHVLSRPAVVYTIENGDYEVIEWFTGVIP